MKKTQWMGMARHPGESRDLGTRKPRTPTRDFSSRDPGLRRDDGRCALAKAGAQRRQPIRWAPASAGAPSRSRRESEGGFSLVELMVVIAIIGLLATIVIINVMPAADRAAVTKARADIATLEQGMDMYRLEHGRYPTTDEGLQALVAGNYIRRLPDDPWGNPYRYNAPGAEGRPFRISSLGADGRDGGDGDDEDIGN